MRAFVECSGLVRSSHAYTRACNLLINAHQRSPALPKHHFTSTALGVLPRFSVLYSPTKGSSALNHPAPRMPESLQLVWHTSVPTAGTAQSCASRLLYRQPAVQRSFRPGACLGYAAARHAHTLYRLLLTLRARAKVPTAQRRSDLAAHRKRRPAGAAPLSPARSARP